ncbi:MAG: hypothetical protein Q9227_009227 [Pyrenula ochraceoflavens]
MRTASEARRLAGGESLEDSAVSEVGFHSDSEITQSAADANTVPFALDDLANMRFQSIFALAALAGAAFAVPNGPKTSSTWKTTSTKAPTSTKATTTAKPTSTPVNNGQQFVNKCENFGISIADCTELLNIALLNGATVNVGGSATPSAGAVNNGQQFLNECKNFGISVLDCAELLNIAALNGLTIDIDLSDITSLLGALGIPTGILGGLLPTSTGLITLPTGIL